MSIEVGNLLEQLASSKWDCCLWLTQPGSPRPVTMGKDKALKEKAPKTKMVEKQEGDDGVRRRSRRVRNLPPQCEDVEEGLSGCSGSKRVRVEEGSEEGGAGTTKPEVKRETPPAMMTRQRYASLKKEGKEEVGLGSLEEVVVQLLMDETGTVELLLEPGGASSSGGIPVTGSGLSSGHGPEELEEEAHPCLFNEDVLDNIFKFILSQSVPGEEVARDIQRIRLVCKTWKNSATRLYRRTRAYAQFDNCSRRFFPRRYSLADFVDTMKASDMLPVQRFIFAGDTFFHFRNRNIFRDFLEIFGPEIVSLKFNLLGRFRFHEYEIFNLENRTTHLERYSLANIPNLNLTKLRQLDILEYGAGRKTKPSRQPHGILNLLEVLLSAGRGLQKLEFFNLLFPPFLDRHVTSIEPVGEVISTRISNTVKILRLHMALTDQDFTALTAKGLKLKKFKFSHPPGLEIVPLRKFLESQAPTLKVLHLCHNFDPQDALALELPRMEELVNLELANSLTGPFSFAKTLPQLRRLKVSEMEPEALSGLLSNSTKASTALKELHLPRETRGPIAPLIKKIAELFPGIRDLHVSVELDDSETLQEIFTHLDTLESLHISLDGDMHNLDAAFTGMSDIDCEELGRRTFRNVNVAGLRRKPSIDNLTRLRKLVLKATEFWVDVVLSNVSAHFVFLEMESLRELSCSGFEHQINPRYMNSLQEKLDHMEWEVWNENNLMEDSDEEVD